MIEDDNAVAQYSYLNSYDCAAALPILRRGRHIGVPLRLCRLSILL